MSWKVRPIEFGKKSENLAVRFLLSKGYKVIDRNYRTPKGELDIVALDGDVLVFIEVKARRGVGFGEPQWAIHRKKRDHMIKACQFYLVAKKLQNRFCRFDIVTIQEEVAGQAKIDIIRNAFDVAETGV